VSLVSVVRNELVVESEIRLTIKLVLKELLILFQMRFMFLIVLLLCRVR